MAPGPLYVVDVAVAAGVVAVVGVVDVVVCHTCHMDWSHGRLNASSSFARTSRTIARSSVWRLAL